MGVADRLGAGAGLRYRQFGVGDVTIGCFTPKGTPKFKAAALSKTPSK
jgi:hypothetical protein